MSEMFVLNDMLTRNKYVRTHAKEARPDTAFQFEREKKLFFFFFVGWLPKAEVTNG